MPIYDYVCTACGTRTEVIHGRHESGPEVCPACGGTLRRALSLPAIVFKGSGWAKKDARAPGHARGKAADGEAKTDESRSEPAKRAGDGGGEQARDDGGEQARGGGEQARGANAGPAGAGNKGNRDAATG